MDFNVPDRVHIMPVGYEKQRVLLSASKFKADKVVLISHSGDSKEDESRIQEIKSGLETSGIKVERAYCNIFDLYDSLGLIAELITNFENDDVYVNVSTGSKVTAIAGMIACMAIDAIAYYAKAEDYSTKYPEGLEFVQELPKYPIDAPEKQQIEMLYVIGELQEAGTNATKGKLIHIGQHIGMPFAVENDVGQKGLYRALDNEILAPMEKRGYIEIYREGREKIVEVTGEGKNALRAFRYLVQKPQKERVAEVVATDRVQ